MKEPESFVIPLKKLEYPSFSTASLLSSILRRPKKVTIFDPNMQSGKMPAFTL